MTRTRCHRAHPSWTGRGPAGPVIGPGRSSQSITLDLAGVAPYLLILGPRASGKTVLLRSPRASPVRPGFWHGVDVAGWSVTRVIAVCMGADKAIRLVRGASLASARPLCGDDVVDTTDAVEVSA
jgi:hypothetical protein